jgi:hypothetical protein
MTMIHRVRISRVSADLSLTDVLVFRMGGTQAEAEAFGHRVQTRWMRMNPGWATVMVTDWPSPTELGGNHVMPDARQIVDAPIPIIG